MKSINEQYRVTDKQLDAATRFVNCATNEVIYIVKSATDPDKEYKVTWNRDFSRFACDPRCRANQNGMCCWHIRSALAKPSAMSRLQHSALKKSAPSTSAS